MQTRRTTPGPRYPALMQLLRTADTLWNTSRVFFARWDLSPSQFNVLNLLYEAPSGLTQVELSRELLMHPSNVTGLVDRLARRKLVERREAPDDRRAWRVVLTAAGQRLIREILPYYYQAAEEVWGDLPVNRTTRLTEDLAAVCANAQRMAAALAATE